MGSTLDNVRDSIMSTIEDSNNKVKKKLSLNDYRRETRSSANGGSRFDNNRNSEANRESTMSTNDGNNSRNSSQFKSSYTHRHSDLRPSSASTRPGMFSNNGYQNSYSSSIPHAYNTKYRTGTDYRGLPWSQLPSKISQLLPNGEEIKTIWSPNDSKFDKFTQLKFDAIVRREAVYRYRMKKECVNNYGDFKEINGQFNNSMLNKMLVMEGGDDLEEKISYLTNEFVLEIEEKALDSSENKLDILSWTVEVTEVTGSSNMRLLTFDNELFCQLTFEIFQDKWHLQRLDCFNEKNRTIVIKESHEQNMDFFASILYSNKEYTFLKKNPATTEDILKSTVFYKLNYKYPQMQSTRILVLYNMLSIQDLKNEELFNKIRNAISSQRSSLLKGSVQIEIPRPGIDMMFNDVKEYYKSGLTKVFVKFDSLENSTEAFQKLDGWYFQGRKVLLGFYSENNFEKGIYI